MKSFDIVSHFTSSDVVVRVRVEAKDGKSALRLGRRAYEQWSKLYVAAQLFVDRVETIALTAKEGGDA